MATPGAIPCGAWRASATRNGASALAPHGTAPAYYFCQILNSLYYVAISRKKNYISEKISHLHHFLHSTLHSALLLRQRLRAPAPVPAPKTLLQLANVKTALGRREEALADLRACLDLKEFILPPGSRELGAACRDLAEAHAAVLDFKQALPLCQKALELHESTLGKNSVEQWRSVTHNQEGANY